MKSNAKMNKPIIYHERNKARIDAMLTEAQHRARVRTTTYKSLGRALKRITDRLGLPRRAMDGVTVRICEHVRPYPSAYGGRPRATWIDAIYHGGHWRITRAYRGDCDGTVSAHITLTDDARAEILHRAGRVSYTEI